MWRLNIRGVGTWSQGPRGNRKTRVWTPFGKQFPTHDVMGEEGTRIETGSDYKWYVDPLDGTTNFAHGYPVFCVSLAVERLGRRIAGVIYDPTRDEMFAAELGSGARLNGEAIHVSATARLGECLVATGFPSQ